MCWATAPRWRPVLEDLARVLAAHPCRARHRHDVDCPRDDLYFRGERQDLEEMAGNLMDNACKWADAPVRVRRARHGGRLVFSRWRMTGRACRAEQRSQVGERGERLDESVPGSGLGLAIVRDISKLYGGFPRAGGQFHWAALLARLELPAIH